MPEEPFTSCEEVREQLDPFVDRELSAAEVEALCRRLEECKTVRHCEKCRQTIAELRRLKTLVARAQPVRIPPGLMERIHRGLKDGGDWDIDEPSTRGGDHE